MFKNLKQLTLSITFAGIVLSAAVFVLPWLQGNASADANSCISAQNNFCIELTLSPTPTYDVNVIATDGEGTSIPTNYAAGNWYVGEILLTSSCQTLDQTATDKQTLLHTINITVKDKASGGVVSTPSTTAINLCGKPTGIVTQTINVAANPKTAAKTGTISGTFKYPATDGSTVVFPKGTIVTITGTNPVTQAIKISVGNNGAIPKTTLTEGVYRLQTSWKPTDSTIGTATKFVDKSFTVVAGKNTDVSETAKSATDPALDAANTTDGSSGSTNDEKCEAAIEMGWIVCSLARAADSFATWLEGVIVSLLRINDSQSAYGGIKDGWSQIRIVSSAVIVLIALLMIASQIFSFDFMSAYTMKKVLPRLVIAAILIQLSWFIFTTMISLVNALGDGVQAILLAPFPGLSAASAQGDTLQFILKTFADNSADGWTFGAGMILLAGGAVVGFAAMGGLAGIALAAIGIIIACLVAFVTLVLRKVLILALLLMAPLALAAWILPGTQKWWDRWWGMFSKLLFMYPLVIGLITVGQIGAYLAAQSGGFVAPAALPSQFAAVGDTTSNMVVFFIILIAYFGPFFFIPSMFKLGGSLLGKVSAMATSGGSALKKARPIRNIEKARDNNKAAKDYNSKQRGLGLANGAGLDNRFTRNTGALGRSVNRMTRNRLGRAAGRLQAGTGGATGAYADKLRQSERLEDLKNATDELTNYTQAMDPGDVRGFQTRFLNARVGESIDGVRVTQRLQEAMVMQALQSRNQNAVDQYRLRVAGTPEGESFNRLVNQNWPSFDEQMPDVTRGQAIGRVAPAADNPLGISSSSQKAVSSYHAIGATRQQQVRVLIESLRAGGLEENRVAAGYLNTIASSADVSDADLSTLAAETGLDLSAVRTSKGKITLEATPTGLQLTGGGPQEVRVVP